MSPRSDRPRPRRRTAVVLTLVALLLGAAVWHSPPVKAAQFSALLSRWQRTELPDRRAVFEGHRADGDALLRERLGVEPGPRYSALSCTLGSRLSGFVENHHYTCVLHSLDLYPVSDPLAATAVLNTLVAEPAALGTADSEPGPVPPAACWVVRTTRYDVPEVTTVGLVTKADPCLDPWYTAWPGHQRRTMAYEGEETPLPPGRWVWVSHETHVLNEVVPCATPLEFTCTDPVTTEMTVP